MVSIKRLCYTARHSEYSELEASIAQLVEQRTRNAKVVGSIPITGTIKLNQLVTNILSLTRDYQSIHSSYF